MEVFFVLIGVFVAAVLTLVSTFILNFCRRRKQASDMKKVLQSELILIQYKLAAMVVDTRIRECRHNHDSLNWLKPIILSYDAPDADLEMRDTVKHLLEMNENRLLKEQHAMSLTRDPCIVQSRKKLRLWYLESQLSSLCLLSPILQQSLIEIQTRMDYINQEIDMFNVFLLKTFDGSLRRENSDLLDKNMGVSIATIDKQAKIVADRITEILPKLDS